MVNTVVKKALLIVENYLMQNFSNKELKIINKEIRNITGIDFVTCDVIDEIFTYEGVQKLLSTLNEKESIRKNKGVYYTPKDVVEFILYNSIKYSFGKLSSNNIHVLDLNGIPYNDFCFRKTIFDPTCGTGEFLLYSLEMKLDILDLHKNTITIGDLNRILKTINGNDVNMDSIILSKIRLLLCLINRYGVNKVQGLSKAMNSCFKNYDYILNDHTDEKYDIIIGNPPYVEDSKSEIDLEIKYGNIYANVLERSAKQLNKNGVMGFIIPLSYISTPRMKKIREELFDSIPEQYVLSYSDRPDCLFNSVHQKLNIILGRKIKSKIRVYTSNYKYWYQEEREELFNRTSVVNNPFVKKEFIPKLGNEMDLSIYDKIIKGNLSLLDLFNKSEEGVSIYLNMRATFWIKAFEEKHDGAEYRRYICDNKNDADYAFCLLNSSLFWWFWICVSDCWHITKKEMLEFKVPLVNDYSLVNYFAFQLENELEETKVHVNTKQTEYAYKHKECINLIHEMDDFINNLYNLTAEESLYIKNFAQRYRVSGGVKRGNN